MVLVAIAFAAAAAHHHLLALASAWRQLLMAALCDPLKPPTFSHYDLLPLRHPPFPSCPWMCVRPAQNENETVAKSHKTAKKLL